MFAVLIGLDKDCTSLLDPFCCERKSTIQVLPSSELSIFPLRAMRVGSKSLFLMFMSSNFISKLPIFFIIHLATAEKNIEVFLKEFGLKKETPTKGSL